MTTATINITPDGIAIADGPLVGGERVPVSASGLDLAEDAALALVLRAQSPAATLATAELVRGDEGGTWTGTLDTATRQAAMFFATAAADEARTVVLELLDTATRDSLALLAAPLRNSALLPSLSPCSVEPIYLGTPGPAGAAATVEVGDVTTLPAGSPATVENVGTASAAVLAFGLPQGADGRFASTTTYDTPDSQGRLPARPGGLAAFRYSDIPAAAAANPVVQFSAAASQTLCAIAVRNVVGGAAVTIWGRSVPYLQGIRRLYAVIDGAAGHAALLSEFVGY